MARAESELSEPGRDGAVPIDKPRRHAAGFDGRHLQLIHGGADELDRHREFLFNLLMLPRNGRETADAGVQREQRPTTVLDGLL